MTDVRLTDIKWIDPGVAQALDRAGVTVETLAAMTANELLGKFPFVGTINAWLLTDEARYVMGQVEAGLWSPQEKLDLEMTLKELEEIERQEALARIRPPMKWPPDTPAQVQTSGKSVRVERIERQRARQAQLDAERERLVKLILEQDEEGEAE
jgi:hypothetical protein